MEKVQESIKKLEGLRDTGIITSEEFEARKKEVVDRFIHEDGASPLERLRPQPPIAPARAPSSQNPYKGGALSETTSPSDQTFVKLRGLPFTASDEDVLNFFKGFGLDSSEPIHFQQNAEGRPTGIAFVKFTSREEASRALSRNKQFLGPRYIEVFPVTFEEVVQKMQPVGTTSWVRMRGILFTATKADILRFFDAPLRDSAIFIIIGKGGRPSGEAFVQFPDENAAQQALQKDRQTMGSRYVELFLSTQDECDSAIARGMKDDGGFGGGYGGGYGGPPPGAYGHPLYAPYPPRPRPRPGLPSGGPAPPGGRDTGEYVIRCRGLPFRATEQDMSLFFAGIQLVETRFVVENGRPSGEAFVILPDKYSMDVALGRNNQSMGQRYVEIFPASFAEMHQRITMAGSAPPAAFPAPPRSGYAPPAGYRQMYPPSMGGGPPYGYRPYGY